MYVAGTEIGWQVDYKAKQSQFRTSGVSTLVNSGTKAFCAYVIPDRGQGIVKRSVSSSQLSASEWPAFSFVLPLAIPTIEFYTATAFTRSVRNIVIEAVNRQTVAHAGGRIELLVLQGSITQSCFGDVWQSAVKTHDES